MALAVAALGFSSFSTNPRLIITSLLASLCAWAWSSLRQPLISLFSPLGLFLVPRISGCWIKPVLSHSLPPPGPSRETHKLGLFKRGGSPFQRDKTSNCVVIFLDGWALIAQNYKYLKIESLGLQIADEKKSDVPLILFLLSCSAAAPQCVNISFIHEKIHYFSQIRDSIEPRLNFQSHITLLWISIKLGRRIFSIIWLRDWAWLAVFFFFVLPADLRACAHWCACCCFCVLSGSLSFQSYVEQVDYSVPGFAADAPNLCDPG